MIFRKKNFQYIIMKIEGTSYSGVLISKAGNRDLSNSKVAHLSVSLQNENKKVLKLIHQKKYPLNHSHRTLLSFPKLKYKYQNDLQKIGKQNKNCFRISLQEGQKNNSAYKLRAQVKEEHILQKKKLNKMKKKFTRDDQGFQAKNQETQIDKDFCSLDRCMITEKRQNNSLFDENWDQATYFHSESQRILIQRRIHFTFLEKMRENIKKKQQQYKNNLYFSHLFDNDHQKKEKCKIQYLVRSLEDKNSPYEKQSPNKIEQFSKLFEKNKRNLLLWEELERSQPDLRKQKSKAEEFNISNTKSKNSNKTIIQKENDIDVENILSAKYRLKNNHKRMIELAKTKAS